MVNSHDVVDLEVRTGVLDNMYSDRTTTSWRERLNMMWRMDQYRMPSPELEFVKDSTQLSLFCGMCYGAYHETAKVQRIFLEQNKYTMFQHPREAQKAMQDRIVLGMMQGGWRAGWRMGVLGFTFTAVSQSLVAVRGYINPLDYGVAGGVMGAIYKINMGPRGMIGAGVGGGLLGLQAGVISWVLQKMTGETVVERWEREYRQRGEKIEEENKVIESKDDRKQIIEEVIEEQVKDEEDNDLVRSIALKAKEWLIDVGILRTDTDFIVNKTESHGNVKVSDSRTTQ